MPMTAVCPQCGGAVQDDSIFCRFCGCKLPDNVERKEIRIEDAAALARAEVEARREAREARQEEEARKKERYVRNSRRIGLLVLAGVGALLFIYGMAADREGMAAVILDGLLMVLGAIGLAIKWLFNGKL